MTDLTQIIRLNISSYQGDNFYQREAELFSDIPNVEYVRSWNGYSPTILISNTHTDFQKLDRKLLEHTRLIIHPNSGYDNFSVEFIKDKGFPVITGNPIRANAVSEYILSALYNHFSSINNQETWDKTRTWNRKRLKDLKIQIIGYGMIGRILEKSLLPIVDKVFISDPYQDKNEVNYSEADVILLACSLNPTSYKIINEKVLSLLSSEALIINAARGGLIDQHALLKYLKNNPNSHAVLDVFESEPFNESDFIGIPNLIKTSHIAGVYRELNQELLNYEKEVVLDYLNKAYEVEYFSNKYQGLILQNRLQKDFLI
jgi:D-3-phosphoglycerate dehydrogenase